MILFLHLGRPVPGRIICGSAEAAAAKRPVGPA